MTRSGPAYASLAPEITTVATLLRTNTIPPTWLQYVPSSAFSVFREWAVVQQFRVGTESQDLWNKEGLGWQSKKNEYVSMRNAVQIPATGNEKTWLTPAELNWKNQLQREGEVGLEVLYLGDTWGQWVWSRPVGRRWLAAGPWHVHHRYWLWWPQQMASSLPAEQKPNLRNYGVK